MKTSSKQNTMRVLLLAALSSAALADSRAWTTENCEAAGGELLDGDLRSHTGCPNSPCDAFTNGETMPWCLVKKDAGCPLWGADPIHADIDIGLCNGVHALEGDCDGNDDVWVAGPIDMGGGYFEGCMAPGDDDPWGAAHPDAWWEGEHENGDHSTLPEACECLDEWDQQGYVDDDDEPICHGQTGCPTDACDGHNKAWCPIKDPFNCEDDRHFVWGYCHSDHVELPAGCECEETWEDYACDQGCEIDDEITYHEEFKAAEQMKAGSCDVEKCGDDEESACETEDDCKTAKGKWTEDDSAEATSGAVILTAGAALIGSLIL